MAKNQVFTKQDRAVFPNLHCFVGTTEFQGFKVYVLSLETIVALKRESQNPKDRYRLQILEETLRQMRKEND